MTETLETQRHDTLSVPSDEELDLERLEFIDKNARAALKQELAGFAIKTAHTPTIESFSD